jgi:hypothetical protein
MSKSNLYDFMPATGPAADNTANNTPVAAPKILLQIKENSNYIPLGSKNPSYTVNVIAYHDGNNLKNININRDEFKRLVQDSKNNILLIENNNSPVKITNPESVTDDVLFRKIKSQNVVENVTSTEETNSENPGFMSSIFGKNAKVAVTDVSGGKRKTIRKKSYRRKLSRRRS